MKEADSLVWKLTLKLELFTSILPIPIFVHFIALVGSSQTLGSTNTIFLAGLVCGTYTVIWGILVRFFRIRRIFQGLNQLQAGELSDTEKIQLKKKIMNYSFVEGKTIVLRWIVGHITGYFFYVSIMREWAFFMLFIETYGLLLTVPISYVMYIFVTEDFMRGLLKKPLVQQIEIDPANVSYFGYFRRILLGIFSVTIIPIAIFGYFLYSSFHAGFKFENPGIHISLLCGAATTAVFIVSFVIANSIKTSLAENNEILTGLGEGNFFIKSSCTTADDFGIQGKLIGKVIQNLKKLYDEINHLNLNLENKVEERTKELSNSLDLITKLKDQQDGDYYLTSLLLKPLGTNRAFTENVKIDFRIKQKKQFQFKNRTSEIGGDLCRTDTIYLKGKPFTVFVNADAMGKSIQGAGGALVLGAVFGSIIERSRIDENIQNYSPEKWLKNSFIELHRIFETFDGSMLISLVLGLVESSNGFLYYINAEHPFTVLYRDGKAQFINRDVIYKKLGVSLANDFIKVSTFQLLAGDIIINGSDGREDLIINKEVVSDSEKFLEIVEDCNCNLEQMTKTLGTEFTLSDDLSLMSIRLDAGFIPPLERWEKNMPRESKISEFSSQKKFEQIELFQRFLSGEEPNPLIWKNWITPLIRSKLYREAFELSLAYIEQIPGDIEILFLSSLAARKLGEIAISLELGERVRIREPEHIRNLYNLVFSYILAENEIRAVKLLSHLQELVKPDKKTVFHRKIRVLENKLEKLRKKAVLPLTINPPLKY